MSADSRPQPHDALVVNAAGERCPRPLLDTQRAAAQATGRRIVVWATDPHFEIDLLASALADRFGEIRIERQALPADYASRRAVAGIEALRIELIPE